MKKDIHPEYKVITVKCACGNVFETRSTRASFTVDICSECHPFFTGKQKILDAAGRVERFRRKYARFSKEPPAPVLDGSVPSGQAAPSDK